MENETLVQNINNILKIISENEISIKEKDLLLFILNIENLIQNPIIYQFYSQNNFNFNKKNTKLSYEYIEKINNLGKRNLIIKLLLALYFYFFENNYIKYKRKFNVSKILFNKNDIYILIQRKINQLFYSQIFNENDIILFSKFLLKINKDIFAFKLIKNIIKIIKGENLICNKIIEEICLFINSEKINFNYFQISKILFFIIDNVELTQENKTHIENILISLHLLKYNKKLFDYLMESTLFHFEKIGNKTSLTNKNTFDIKNLFLSFNLKLDFLKKLIEKEYELFFNDNYKLFSGFIINKSSFIKLNKINNLGKTQGCTIIISFNFSKIKNEKIIILNLIKEKSLIPYFSIYIENESLFFSISQFKKEDFSFPKEKDILIKENNTYLIIFSIEKANSKRITITVNGKEYDYTLKYGKNIDYPFKCENSELYIYNNLNKNKGIIGTIFLFDGYFPKEIIKIISSFKGNYENIVLYNECHLYNFKNNIRNHLNDFMQLSEFNLIEKLKTMITPKITLIEGNNNKLKENYFNIKSIRDYDRDIKVNGEIKAFNNLSLSVYNFLYYDGLKFLQLNCEFYYQILITEKIKDYEIINQKFLNLIKFLQFIIRSVNNDFLYFQKNIIFENQNLMNDSFIDLSNEKLNTETNELIFIFSSICEIIKLLKGDKSLIIEEFIGILPLLCIKNKSEFISSLTYKFINFLLDINLYKNETKNLLSNVYLKIDLCLDCSKVDLLKCFLLDKLIDMNDNSEEFNQLFDHLINKIIKKEELKLNNLSLDNHENNEINLIEYFMKKIIKKLRDSNISLQDLTNLSNILKLFYKNLNEIKFESEEIIEIKEVKKEILERKDSEKNKKTNQKIKKEEINEDDKFKGFIFSGLKAAQSINNKNKDYLNKIDYIKAIFIQFIHFIKIFDEQFFKILIELQRLDFDEGHQILIDGKKSFLSFYSLLFKQIKFNKFENLIENEIFKINEEKINDDNFIERFKYLLELVQNFSNDEILKVNDNNPKILLYMRQLIYSFIMNILKDFTSKTKTEKKNQIIFQKALHSHKNLLIQYYQNYKIIDDEGSKLFYSEIINISEILINHDDIGDNDNNPFIFDLIFDLYVKYHNMSEINKKIIPEIYKFLIFNLNSSLSNEIINESNLVTKNIVYSIILFYKLLSRFKNINFSDPNDINSQFCLNFSLNSFLFSFDPFFYNSKTYNLGNDNYKYFLEIIIEIFIELYLLTREINYINFIRNCTLKQPYNDTSYFYDFDKKYIEPENEKKGFFNFFQKNDPQKKEQRKLMCIHYYIKFTLYSLNRKKCDNLIKPLYIQLKEVLEKNIFSLFSNKKILKDKLNLINAQSEKDILYKRVFSFFYYEKYKDPKKVNNGEEYIKRKIKKEKYNEIYKKYFKLSYGKNGKVKEDNNNEISLNSTFKTSKTLKKVEFHSSSLLGEINIKKKLSFHSNEEEKNTENIFQDEKIDEFIHKFEKNIICKKYNVFKDNFLIDFHEINIRKVLCKNIFAEYFKKYLFNNEFFLELRKNYLKHFYYNQINNVDSDCYLRFPSKLRNYSNQNNYIRIFLKPDLHYFTKESFPICHKKINLNFTINNETNNLSLFKNRINLNFDFSNSQFFDSELITNDYITQGIIFLTENYFIYKSNSSQNKDERISRLSNTYNSINKVFSSFENDINKIKIKNLYFRYEDIIIVYVKRFLYQFQAIEIFLLNGKSYFFNLLNIQNKENLIVNLKNKNIQIITDLKEYFNKKNIINNYLENKLSTLDYLLNINFYSSRTFNDLNQYYIFPWLSVLDENSLNVKLRDFKYPLSAQNPNKRDIILFKYEEKENNNEKKNKFINHYNSHYSTSAFVNFYLIRISPFNENIIKLQNGKYDDPNRAFVSITEVLEILNKFEDNRELIPDFFYLTESYLNLNYNNYGKRDVDKLYINNIIFDNYFNGYRINIINPFKFMIRYRKLLESSIISKSINVWIDNIFGVNQLNPKKEDCNLFSKYSYAEKNNFNLLIEKYNKKNLSIEDICLKIKEKTSFILNFGQTPMKLFEEKVKEKKNLIKNCSINTQKIKKNGKNNSIDDFKSLDIINKKTIIFLSYCHLNKKLFIIEEKAEGVFLSLFENSNETNLELNEITKINLKGIILDNFQKLNDEKYIYNLRNSLTYLKYDEERDFIIVSNQNNNSIIFHSNNMIDYCFILPSFTCSIISISNNEIITGHFDGIIIHWKLILENKSLKLEMKKKINASNKPILSISYNKDFNIVLTNNNKDCSVCIRKLYNFELISVIYLNTYNNYFRYLIVDQKMNNFNFFIYIIAYYLNKFSLHCYTVNGIKICEKLDNICKSFYIFNNGNILTYSYILKGFIVSKGEDLNDILFIKKLDNEKDIIYFEFDENAKFIYYIYNNNNIQNMNYLCLTNEDMEQIYKEENFFENEQNVHKDIWDDIEEYGSLNDTNYKKIKTESSSI